MDMAKIDERYASAEAHVRVGDYAHAVTIYDELLDGLSRSGDQSLRVARARVLVAKAVALNSLHDDEAAIRVLDEVIELPGARTDAAFDEQVARALGNKAFILATSGQHEAAIALDDVILQDFGDSRDPRVAEQVELALYNKGDLLRTLGRTEERLVIYDSLSRRLVGKGSGLEADCLLQQAHCLYELGRRADARKVYQRILGQVAKLSEFQAASARYNAAVIADELCERDVALEEYDAFLREHGASGDEAVAPMVDQTRERVARLRSRG